MSEERDRLQAMVDDTKSTTWDHSPNDRKAIKWALERIDELEALAEDRRQEGMNRSFCDE